MGHAEPAQPPTTRRLLSGHVSARPATPPSPERGRCGLGPSRRREERLRSPAEEQSPDNSNTLPKRPGLGIQRRRPAGEQPQSPRQVQARFLPQGQVQTHSRLVKGGARNCAPVPIPNQVVPPSGRYAPVAPLTAPALSQAAAPAPRGSHTRDADKLLTFVRLFRDSCGAYRDWGGPRVSSRHGHHPRHAPLRPSCPPRHVQPSCPGCQPLHRIRSNAGLRCPRGRWPSPRSAPARSGFGSTIRIPNLGRPTGSLGGLPAPQHPWFRSKAPEGDPVGHSAFRRPPPGRCQPGAESNVTGATPGTAAPDPV